MSNDNIATLADNINKGIDNRLKDLHTATPGIIESFDPVAQTVSVQPAIKRIFKTLEGTSEVLSSTNLPILINVPIIYPRGGGYSLTFPIVKGDECLILFNERSIDNWHKFGTIKEPNDRRFHSLSDAVVLVGLSSLPNKIPTYDNSNVVIKKDDDSSYIKVKSNSDIEMYSNANLDITTVGDVNVDCANVDVNASTTAVVTCPESTFNGNVTVNGNITCTGTTSSPNITASTSLIVNGQEMDDHRHSQADDSGGNTEQDTGGPI